MNDGNTAFPKRTGRAAGFRLSVIGTRNGVTLDEVVEFLFDLVAISAASFAL